MTTVDVEQDWLTLIDFDAEVPCNSQRHPDCTNAAVWSVETHCPIPVCNDCLLSYFKYLAVTRATRWICGCGFTYGPNPYLSINPL